MPKPHLFLLLVLLHFTAFGQSQEFEVAYLNHPKIPRGFLEAIAFTHTRMSAIPVESNPPCSGMPLGFGIMGVFENGHKYFTENAKIIANISGLSIENQKSSIALQIESYARACDAFLVGNKQLAHKPEETIYALMWELTEIPKEGSSNLFAFESSVYDVLLFLNNEEYAAKYKFPLYDIRLKEFFGENNYTVLSSPSLTLDSLGIKTRNNQRFLPKPTLKSINYNPAIWNAAPACNFSSRNGVAVSAVTIHTVQGTYAGAISWGLNCNAQVSYHYVIRSSDGQITQMVMESQKAWHVGSENSYTVGIEHEGYVSNAAWYTPSLYQSSANLVKDISQSGYSINPLRTFDGNASGSVQLLGNCIRIKGHQHYANQSHTDPGIYWNWNKYYGLINDNPVPIIINNNTGTLYDSGGANGAYSSDERTVWVIQSTPGNQIQLQFTSFELELNYDKLYVYDGATVGSPLIGVFSGNTIPAIIQSSGNQLTVEFRTDCATNLSGWVAHYQTQSNGLDQQSPVSSVNYSGYWQTQDFIANIQSTDSQSGVEGSYLNVSSRNTSQNGFYSNSQKGYFRDEFSGDQQPWTAQTGNYQCTAGTYLMSDATQNNSNSYAQLKQEQNGTYLYCWKHKINSNNSNQRIGMHFFCSDPTLPNRGNSYFVYFREETDKVQIYKVLNDVFSLVKEDTAVIITQQWEDVKVHFNSMGGWIKVFHNGILVSTWQDPQPLQNGNAISLRSGACSATFDEVYVYKSHLPQELISVGIAQDIEHQSDHQMASGNIRVLAIDSSGNWSLPYDKEVQVDWTGPEITFVNDGLSNDIDTFYTQLLENNWWAIDNHSGILNYEMAIGTSMGNNDVQAFLNIGTNTHNQTLLVAPLQDSVYYSQIQSTNNAGLISTGNSDGQLYLSPMGIPLPSLLSSIQMYPNPNSGNQINIHNLPFPVEITLIDANGKEVQTFHLSQDGVLETTLAKGVYYVRIYGNDTQITHKLVVY